MSADLREERAGSVLIVAGAVGSPGFTLRDLERLCSAARARGAADGAKVAFGSDSASGYPGRIIVAVPVEFIQRSYSVSAT